MIEPRKSPVSPSRPFRLALLGALTIMTAGAQAQFQSVPPVQPATPPASQAQAERAYRVDAARHLYASYAKNIYRGKRPPLLYSVMIVETEIDSSGQVRAVNVVRKPAASEVAPWVTEMIRRAAPYPAPVRMASASVRYTDIWLVDKSGRFQVDTLTEGQR
jgi:hypothetical protein